jgi:hypothetical protein
MNLGPFVKYLIRKHYKRWLYLLKFSFYSHIVCRGENLRVHVMGNILNLKKPKSVFRSWKHCQVIFFFLGTMTHKIAIVTSFPNIE